MSLSLDPRLTEDEPVSDFDALLAAAYDDHRIAGVILGGSRGKGFGTDRSDWDVYLVTVDGALPDDVARSLPEVGPEVQLCAALTMSEFAQHADVGHAKEWDRYNFAHVTPVLDRTDGQLGRLCQAKEWLPDQVAEARAALFLDGYLNSYYRAVKNARDGSPEAALLDAAESVNHMLNFVFAAERRARPYNKYLAWELTIHPLSHAWWPSADPVNELLRVVRGDPAAGAKAFGNIERTARHTGFAGVLDAWGEECLIRMRRGGP